MMATKGATTMALVEMNRPTVLGHADHETADHGAGQLVMPPTMAAA